MDHSTCSGAPRTEQVDSAGPDWRIVANGRRYRVQHRTLKSDDGDIWEDLQVFSMFQNHFILGNFTPFETRFLWRARARLRREKAAIDVQQLKWTEVP